MSLIGVAILAFLAAGIAQSLTGFGSALVAAPLLALVADMRTTVVTVTLVSLGLTAWAAWREREHVAVGLALRTSLAGLVGVPIGLLLLMTAGDVVLAGMMAATVLVALALTIADVRLPATAGTTWTIGLASGVLVTATGMNGPPLVLGMNARRLDPRAFRGTLQAVLCVQDLIALLGFLLVGGLGRTAPGLAAIGIVAGPIGWLLGDRVFDRIPARHFRRVVVAGLCTSAVLLVVRH